MVRPAGWSGCGSSPTVLPSRRGGIIGRQEGVAFESKLTLLERFWPINLVLHFSINAKIYQPYASV